MKDYQTAPAKLNATQRSSIRAHAQNFARRHDLDRSVDDMEWSDLAAMIADARRASRDVVAECRDGTPDKVAAAIEGAQLALMALVDMIEAEMDARTARGDRGKSTALNTRTTHVAEFKQSRDPWGNDGAADAPGYALEKRQTMRSWAQAKGAEPSIGAGQFLRALVTGARTDAEHRALGGGSDAAGGHTVPVITSSELIDLARSEMVLARAGSRIVPLGSSETIFAKLLSDPTAAFRAENSAVTESDPTFAATILAPKSIAVLVKASVELMQDSINLERELPLILARALAVEIDAAGLTGSGTGNEPLGITNFTGLTANGFSGGALESYAPLLQARGALHGANEKLTAFILASRDENALAGLVASDGQPLQMPRALDGVAMLHTTSLPIDGGAGDDESQIIAGDFAQLMMGVRSDIRVEILKERFADNLQFGLIAHARVDFAASRDAAFSVLSGITPA